MDENMSGTEVARRAARQWLDENELVALSVLSLDHPEPIHGWEITLETREIELLEDDLYRPAIRREDARQLVEERREWERESTEKARRLQESLETPPLPAGVPALEDGSAMDSLMANDPGYQTVAEEFAQRPKPNFLAEELEAGARHQAAARAEVAAKKAAREGKDR